MTMNRQQRRQAARQARSNAPSEACPCCNARQIMTHFMRHGAEIGSFDGQPLTAIFHEDDRDKAVAVVDLGVVSIQVLLESGHYGVTALGEVVMQATPSSFQVLKPGKWIGAIASIREMLDARFGPVEMEGMPIH